VAFLYAFSYFFDVSCQADDSQKLWM